METLRVEIPLLTHRNVHVSGIKELRFPFSASKPPKITTSTVRVRVDFLFPPLRHLRGSKTLAEVRMAAPLTGNADGER